MTPKPYALSSKALVFDPQGRCLLLRRSPACRNNAGLWELPGGKLEAGERPDEGLVREIQEETGLSVTVAKVAGAAESELPDRKVAYLFFEALANEENVRLSDEHDAYEWVTPGRLADKELCPQYRTLARGYAGRTSGGQA
jgi:8-oxo-dGTP diphosphatase